MKKTLLIFFLIISVVFVAKAQLIGESLSVTNLKLTLDKHNNVEVMFDISTTKKVVGSNYTLILTPELIHGDQKITLSQIMIEGRNAVISRKRQSLSNKDNEDVGDNTILIRNGEKIVYTATTPYQDWMEGSVLQMVKILKGCCNAFSFKPIPLADNIKIVSKNITVPVIEKEKSPWVPQPTTGDLLSEKYSFISHESEYTGDINPDKNSTIYFTQSESQIEKSYRNNREVLDEVVYVIRTIEKSKDSKITRILIAGFASPEGALATNEKLGMQRAIALKRFILDNSGVKESEINMHNGVVDWDELKKMVKTSDLKDKNEIIHIINNIPVWDSNLKIGRLGQLMNLNGGRSYHYMFDNFFPELRSASYIKIYYNNLKENHK